MEHYLPCTSVPSAWPSCYSKAKRGQKRWAEGNGNILRLWEKATKTEMTLVVVCHWALSFWGNRSNLLQPLRIQKMDHWLVSPTGISRELPVLQQDLCTSWAALALLLGITLYCLISSCVLQIGSGTMKGRLHFLCCYLQMKLFYCTCHASQPPHALLSLSTVA